jgi:hypothetical protein
MSVYGCRKYRCGAHTLGTRVLRGRALVWLHEPGRPCRGVEVRNRVDGEIAIGDRPAGMRRAPPLGGAGGQTPADRQIALHGRVDVKQVCHLSSPS